jgi:hypothetical protein
MLRRFTIPWFPFQIHAAHSSMHVVKTHSTESRCLWVELRDFSPFPDYQSKHRWRDYSKRLAVIHKQAAKVRIHAYWKITSCRTRRPFEYVSWSWLQENLNWRLGCDQSESKDHSARILILLDGNQWLRGCKGLRVAPHSAFLEWESKLNWSLLWSECQGPLGNPGLPSLRC